VPRTSLRVPAIRAAAVAATAAAALLTATPATVPAGPTQLVAADRPVPRPLPTTTPTALPAAAPALVPAPAAPAGNPLFPPPAPAAAQPAAQPAPAQPVAAPVQPVGQTTPAATGGSAMGRALSKVGAPYRWGATGPNAFDCSGLVTWAYQNSGVSLPRTSRAMSTVGTSVARADLRPGDLVFFHRPVSHVGIYIGEGKIVHASSRKSPVKISDMGRMKFTAARRV
jgi:peptidoglycan DL-endopeptidase CwlO